MKAIARVLCIAAAVWALVPTSGFAQASSAGSAVRDIHVGQVHTGYVSDTRDTWYRYWLRGGRSYCAEAGAYEFDDSSSPSDPVLTVLGADAITQIAPPNDDLTDEPGSYYGSRVCFILSGSGNFSVYVKLSDESSGGRYYQVRLVETTLFSNWFFVGGDYSAFSIIRNTTSSTISYTINWRDVAGTVVATYSGQLPPNGTTYPDGRVFGGVFAAGSGSVEVVHTGSPDAVVASTTVLSGTTGLSFDAPFNKRHTW